MVTLEDTHPIYPGRFNSEWFRVCVPNGITLTPYRKSYRTLRFPNWHMRLISRIGRSSWWCQRQNTLNNATSITPTMLLPNLGRIGCHMGPNLMQTYPSSESDLNANHQAILANRCKLRCNLMTCIAKCETPIGRSTFSQCFLLFTGTQANWHETCLGLLQGIQFQHFFEEPYHNTAYSCPTPYVQLCLKGTS